MTTDSVTYAAKKKPVPFEQELIEVLKEISIQINVLPDKLADAIEYRLRGMAEEQASEE